MMKHENLQQKRLSQIYFGFKTEDLKLNKKSVELFYIKCDHYSKYGCLQKSKKTIVSSFEYFPPLNSCRTISFKKE